MMKRYPEPIDIYALWIKEELEVSVLPYLPHFSPKRQQDILVYRRSSDRNRTMWAELLARYLLCTLASADWSNVYVERSQGGKPYGKVWTKSEEESWAISLSHSGSWILCSIGQGESGVDVETETEAWEEIAGQFFLPKRQRLCKKCHPYAGNRLSFAIGPSRRAI